MPRRRVISAQSASLTSVALLKAALARVDERHGEVEGGEQPGVVAPIDMAADDDEAAAPPAESAGVTVRDGLAVERNGHWADRCDPSQ